MGTTPNFGLRYPELPDAANVPLDMSELALDVDGAMLGRAVVDAKGDLLAATAPDTVARVPVGANGRVLTADSAAAAGVSWQPGPAGSYVPVTLPDAKGDLFGATGPDAPARVPVGADGTVLTADAAQALGVKWATPAAGGGAAPALVTTLPASPSDGLEVVLTDNLATPTYQWSLRYVASITDANKWIFTGGDTVSFSSVADDNLGAGTAAWSDTATLIRVVLPRAGEYEVEGMCSVYSGTANVTGFIGVWVGTAASQASTSYTNAVVNGLIGYTVIAIATGVPAGGDIRLRYYQNQINTHFTNRVIRVRPRRIA